MLLYLKYIKYLGGMSEILKKFVGVEERNNKTETQQWLTERKNSVKFSDSKINAHGKNKLKYRYITVDSKPSLIVWGRNLGVILDICLKNQSISSNKIDFEALLVKEMIAKLRTSLHHSFSSWMCACGSALSMMIYPALEIHGEV